MSKPQDRSGNGFEPEDGRAKSDVPPHPVETPAAVARRQRLMRWRPWLEDMAALGATLLFLAGFWFALSFWNDHRKAKAFEVESRMEQWARSIDAARADPSHALFVAAHMRTRDCVDEEGLSKESLAVCADKAIGELAMIAPAAASASAVLARNAGVELSDAW